jgi:hypothetical protein
VSETEFSWAAQPLRAEESCCRHCRRHCCHGRHRRHRRQPPPRLLFPRELSGASKHASVLRPYHAHDLGGHHVASSSGRNETRCDLSGVSAILPHDSAVSIAMQNRLFCRRIAIFRRRIALFRRRIAILPQDSDISPQNSAIPPQNSYSASG